jgi:hypothetical protein
VKGKAKTIYLPVASLITEIKTNMLLIIVLGLIANSTSVSGDCDFGASDVDDFDWNKLGNSVMSRFPEKVSC